jgi:urease accessory protein
MTTPETSPAAWLHILQTSDALYPTGAYAHSFGLEGLVELGVVTDAPTLEDYLANSLLPQLVESELPWVYLAHAAAMTHDLPDLILLDRECRAQRATRELREASGRIGGQRLRLAAESAGHPFLSTLVQRLDAGEFSGQAPVIAGLVAGCAGVGAEAAATAHAYQAISGQLSAAMKLIRFGQQGAQQMLNRLLPALAGAAGRAAAIPRGQIGWFAPALDIASARHESAYTRLFIS